LRYLSVCSGVEAATVAWHPLGWIPVGFSEIEKFPSAVLAHHYPDVPNFGDFTRIEADAVGPIDLLVGGTPCQSFSVAGLRGGLDDDRGNLALEFCRLAQRTRPRRIIWENVPGVLSLDGGRAFASILGGLAECGYGLAYRVLDAQFVRTQSHPRAVPQRRRRVFVVGYLGDWRRAAAVLFERESMRRDTPPSRKSGKDVAPTISARTQGGGGLGTDFDCDGGLVTTPNEAELAMQSLRGDVRGRACDRTGGPRQPDAAGMSEMRNGRAGDIFDGGLIASTDEVSHCLTARTAQRIDASEDGTGRGTPIVPVAIEERAVSDNPDTGPDGSHANAGGQLGVALDLRGREGGSQFEGPHETANIRAGSGGSSKSYVAQPWAVRRLTPTECERLQGFPDGYTQIPYRGKPAADGPRYKALGNSMAVNVMRWIGERIKIVEDISG
jgi:DNA (cytosine-5)-methyltransferase 1